MKSEHMSQTYWCHGQAEIKKTAFFFFFFSPIGALWSQKYLGSNTNPAMLLALESWADFEAHVNLFSYL